MALQPSPLATVDARGHRCPTPTLRLRKALELLPEGARVELRADDPLARIDVPHFVETAGHKLVEAHQDGRALVFIVEKGAPAQAAESPQP